jgi:hypothetical protein
MSDVAAEVHWSRQFLVGKVRELQAAIDRRAPPSWLPRGRPAGAAGERLRP